MANSESGKEQGMTDSREKCPTCQGTGNIVTAEWSNVGLFKAGKMIPSAPKFCPTCDGKGHTTKVSTAPERLAPNLCMPCEIGNHRNEPHDNRYGPCECHCAALQPSNQKDSSPSGVREFAEKVAPWICDPSDPDAIGRLATALETYTNTPALHPTAMLGCREHGTYCRAGYEIALAAKEEAERQLFDTLGFKIEPAELIEDITIRPNDESESTSAVVWCKSSPGMAASMLAGLWKEAVSLLQRQPAPAVQAEKLDTSNCYNPFARCKCGKPFMYHDGNPYRCYQQAQKEG